MPTYDYECTECGNVFEVFHAMSADPVKECPECKGAVKRLLGVGSGVLFKGSGFYETDYRGSGYSKDKAADKPKPAAPEKAKK